MCIICLLEPCEITIGILKNKDGFGILQELAKWNNLEKVPFELHFIEKFDKIILSRTISVQIL